MAERPKRQGWRVPVRAPAIATVGVLALVAILLLIAARIYEAKLAPQRLRAVHAFPAPGVEAYVHDGQGDPPRPSPPPPVDPAIAAAKQAVVAEGLAGWRS